MRRVNGWLTLFWIVIIPVSIVTGWINSVTYVAALSIWALVSGHWSTWQAARVEVTQQQEAAERKRYPIEDKVVRKMVAETEISPSSATNYLARVNCRSERRKPWLGSERWRLVPARSSFTLTARSPAAPSTMTRVATIASNVTKARRFVASSGAVTATIADSTEPPRRRGERSSVVGCRGVFVFVIADPFASY
jgi:hypothetical protein